MRDILFKAKRIENGEWVEGNLVLTPKADEDFKAIIIPFDDNGEYTEGVNDNDLGFETWYKVDMTTICQYTGLTDKNGNKIWENDVVEFEDTGEEGYEYKEGYDFINRARVEFAEARWSLTDFIDTNSGVVDEMYNHIEFMDFWQYCEVKGNIFDNAELIEGSEEE